MNQSVMYLLIGLFSGILITLLILWFAFQRVMRKESVSHLEFEAAVERLTTEVESMDWRLLHVHDLEAKMKAFGYDVLEARVFDICKPEYASRILLRNEERIFSSMMPCRVSIYRKADGKTYISRMNAGLVALPMKGIVPGVMRQAANDVEKILAPLITQ